jgi:hypothetical protein
MKGWIPAAIVFTLGSGIAVPTIVTAHGGGLDGYGCHHNRKAGGYHCHRGQFAGQSFGSQSEMLQKLKQGGQKKNSN